LRLIFQEIARVPLKVNEIFYSIQGESLYTGLACVFIRLTGCNLRCRYCDTRYAYSQGIDMEIGSILERVAGFKCPLVEITGGEPLLQQDTPMLIDALLDFGFTVLLETNGSFDLSGINPRCSKIVDLKCPSSGQAERNHLPNLGRLRMTDQLKCVIGDRKDYEYACRQIVQLPASLPLDHVLFSPVHGQMALAELAAWMLSDRLGVRFHLQLHKVIWPNRNRGV
jgi:7-carboxy-7-deazaguanine synthase